jgi:hypothetical protein
MKGAVCVPETIPVKCQDKYLLVFIYTFSEWMNTFSTQTEKPQEVARHLLKEVIL